MSTPIVPTLKGQCIAEFLGTALVIFFGTGCVAALKLGGADLGLWEICIIWGIGVSMAVYLAAGVSGAHLNPAVTIALWLFGTFERHRVPAYILAQVAGAFCSAMPLFQSQLRRQGKRLAPNYEPLLLKEQYPRVCHQKSSH